MKNELRLEPKEFANLIRHAPLVSIDLLVNNEDAQILLGKRANAPAKDMWFVPGGRIYKGERLAQALGRVIGEELGIDANSHATRFLGVFDHIYEENVFGDPDFGTHFVVLAHALQLEILPDRLPPDQHSSFRWWSINDLSKSPDVHPYTKAYFEGHTPREK